MKKYEMPAAVGGNSLLVIFAVLCLVILALLGVATVEADGRLTKATVKSVEAFYEADTKAEEILALLRQGVVSEGVEQKDNKYHYYVDISEVQSLEVEVLILEDSYEILQWNVISTTEWQEEDELNVWNG